MTRRVDSEKKTSPNTTADFGGAPTAQSFELFSVFPSDPVSVSHSRLLNVCPFPCRHIRRQAMTRFPRKEEGNANPELPRDGLRLRTDRKMRRAELGIAHRRPKPGMDALSPASKTLFFGPPKNISDAGVCPPHCATAC